MAFYANLNSSKTVTKEGDTIYDPPSYYILYISITFAIFSLLTVGLSMYEYSSIFGFLQQSPLVLSELVGSLSFVSIILNIFFLVRKYNYCPNGKEFNTDLNMCVEICTPGSYLTVAGICHPGCAKDSDCLPDQPCIIGSCCDLTTHQVMEGTCCPNDHIVKDADGKERCCPLVCGTECCSSEDEFTCYKDPEKGTSECRVKCGDNTCSRDDVCVRYSSQYTPSDGMASSTQENEFSYACVPLKAECSPEFSKFYPDFNEGNFRPAYDGNVDETTHPINAILQNAPNTQAFQDAMDVYDKQLGAGNKGYICGLPNAVYFESQKYDDCSDITHCLNSLHYPYTEEVGIIDDGSGGYYCNQFLNMNKTLPTQMEWGEEKDPLSYYTTSRVTEVKKPDGQALTLVTQDSKDTNFPVAFSSLKTSSTGEGCSDESHYQPSCQASFSGCIDSQQCPFTASGVTECHFTGEGEKAIGFITDAAPVPQGCQVYDGGMRRVDDPQGKYEKALDDQCKLNSQDFATRSYTRVDTFSGTCAQGCPGDADYCSYWAKDQPHNCCASQFETHAGGARKCDLQQISDNVKHSVCPKNSIPFFSVGQTQKSDKGCGNYHDAFYAEMQYQCCDIDQFDPNDPETAKWCSDNKTIYWDIDEDTKTNPTWILLGRGGGKDCGNYTDNQCDLDASSCGGYLNEVTSDVNKYTYEHRYD